MKTDRELLELAAKAAGMNVLLPPWPDVDGWFFCEHHGSPALHFRKIGNPHHYSQPWRPLTDDGDALRLAVKLGLVLNLSPREDCRGQTVVTYQGVGKIEEPCYESREAAARRAIVRAAAAIGEQP
jgi:hypothetical protein